MVVVERGEYRGFTMEGSLEKPAEGFPECGVSFQADQGLLASLAS